jgi:hypothetical protein
MYIYLHTHTHAHHESETNHDVILNTRLHTSTYVCSYLDIAGLALLAVYRICIRTCSFHRMSCLSFAGFAGLFIFFLKGIEGYVASFNFDIVCK